MNQRVGILGLLCAAAVGFLHPAVASAQDRDDYRRGGYEQRDNRGRDFRADDRNHGRDYRDNGYRDNRWREAREREDWRVREWREHERYDRAYAPAYSYGYGYAPPVVRFGFRFNGR